MIPNGMRREFPVPSLKLFVALQMLDILTTLIGLRAGAGEASPFIGRLMHISPITALLIAKIYAVLLVALAMRFRRPRLVVFINYWFAAVVGWNLCIILMARWRWSH